MGDKKGVDWNTVLKGVALALVAGGAGYAVGQMNDTSAEARYWAERSDRRKREEDEELESEYEDIMAQRELDERLGDDE